MKGTPFFYKLKALRLDFSYGLDHIYLQILHSMDNEQCKTKY